MIALGWAIWFLAVWWVGYWVTRNRILCKIPGPNDFATEFLSALWFIVLPLVCAFYLFGKVAMIRRRG